jgi:hypothetical protein
MPVCFLSDFERAPSLIDDGLTSELLRFELLSERLCREALISRRYTDIAKEFEQD